MARAGKLRIGNGLDESVEVGPQVNPNQIETSAKYVEIALAEGAKLLTGGHALTEGAYAHGTFFAPTVLGGVTPSMRIAREEVFGPVVSLIEFETFEDAIEIANSIDYGLSTALYTKDVNRAFTAIRDLESGITYINAPTIGAEVHLPFGGVKHTGNGHREGLGAIDFFSTWKAVYIDYSDKLQRAQIDNARSEEDHGSALYELLGCRALSFRQLFLECWSLRSPRLRHRPRPLSSHALRQPSIPLSL